MSITVSTTSTIYSPTGDCTGSSANQKSKRTVSPTPTSTPTLSAPQCLYPYTNSPSALTSKCLSYYPAGTSTEITTTQTFTRTHFNAPTHTNTITTTVTTVTAPPECAATATASASAALADWTKVYDVCGDTRNINWDSTNSNYALVNVSSSDACGALASCAGQVPYVDIMMPRLFLLLISSVRAGATSFELVFYNIPYLGLSWLCEWYYTNDYQLVYDGHENEYGDVSTCLELRMSLVCTDDEC